MKMSEDFKQVISAIHNVQQAIEVIQRTETGNTGKRDYKYASLPRIWVAIKGELNKNGLTIMQPPTHAISDILETWIFHESGEWVFDGMRLVINREDPQGMGMAVSYARRYALVSMLGIVTDDDNDATTQRLADGEMKKDWVRAYTIIARKANPDKQPTNSEFIAFMNDVYGKHPTKVLASEHQAVLDTINAFDG